MQQIFTTSFFFMMILAIQNLHAQENQQARQMIVGKWKFYKTETPDKEEQLKADKQIEALNEHGCYFEYKADGTWECKYRMIIPDGNGTTIDRDLMKYGKWEVSVDGKVLTSIFPSGERASVSLTELTHNKMVKEANGYKNTFIK